jgi:hypothetical protein
MTRFVPSRSPADTFRTGVRGKRAEEMTPGEMLQYVELLIDELSVRVDAMIPGADDNQHYTDHIDIANERMERIRIRLDTASRLRAGFILGVAALVTIVCGLVILKGLGYI